MLIFKHHVKPFGEPNEAVCGKIVTSKTYLVERSSRVTCPICRVISKIETPERTIQHIDEDIVYLVSLRNKILDRSK